MPPSWSAETGLALMCDVFLVEPSEQFVNDPVRGLLAVAALGDVFEEVG